MTVTVLPRRQIAVDYIDFVAWRIYKHDFETGNFALCPLLWQELTEEKRNAYRERAQRVFESWIQESNHPKIIEAEIVWKRPDGEPKPR